MEAIYLKIKDMLKAYYPVLYLTSYEYDRTKQKIEGIVNILRSENKKLRLFNWNCVDGLRLIDGVTQSPVQNKDGEEIIEPEETLKYILNDRESSKDIFVLEDFNNYIEEENVKYYIRSIAEKARHTNSHAIVLSAVYKLPVELEKYVTVLNIPLPDRGDMEKTLGVVERQCKINLTLEMRNRMVDAALGMTSMEADLAFCLAAVKDDLGPNAPYTVSSEKEQIIKKSGILDYFPKNESLKDVGGMDILKDWLFKRQKAYEKKARDFGLQEPKGLLLLGVPGCGKSLTAKSIASFWNMPLLRLDIGKVYQGLVGSSEDNIRKAIATAEAVAPCVLWIDEIEKGLSGTRSSSITDGGTTSRIFSTILTWMQEKTKPVFVVATDIEYGYDYLPVRWNEDSSIAVYENKGHLYFCNFKDSKFSKQLPEKYRIAINLFYYEQLSTEQIAEIMRTKPTTVRSYLHRGREKLKEMMEADGYVG